MKTKFLILTGLYFIAFRALFSQDFNSSITINDITDALAIEGIQIHKFDIGSFQSRCQIQFTFDEYINGEIIKSDTIPVFIDNQIINKELDTLTGEYLYKITYLDNLKVITKILTNDLTFHIITRNGGVNEIRDLRENYDSGGFYQIFENQESNWKLYEKVPLITCVSSWKDQNTGQNRLCGVFPKLLEDSPHYFELCYFVIEIDM